MPYNRVAGGASGDPQAYSNNQVFESSEFANFLSELWKAAGETSADRSPPILKQSLAVLRNDWFGVQDRAAVTIVWVYLNFSSEWCAQFTDAGTQALIHAERKDLAFPNYDVFSTHLSAPQINLLAHLSSWSMVSTEQSTQVFSKLFES